MNISLHLIYETDSGQRLTAAKVYDATLIKETAKLAISTAFERARMIGEQDEFLGDVQREEAERLQRVLSILIPDLKDAKGELPIWGKN